VVVLPSFSVGESLLSHYGDRIPSLEHRYLLTIPLLARVQSCEMVFVCSKAPADVVLDYYFSLVPAASRDAARRRYRVVEVADSSARAVAARALDRPDVIAALADMCRDRIAFIEPWNVTTDEVRLAEALGVPINGTDPDLWHLGFKSSGRRLFAQAGVPVPVGHEDITTIEAAMDAAADIRRRCPDAPGVVVKTDDSGAGDGNVVIRFRGGDVRSTLEHLPAWYVDDLSRGGVVEELIDGTAFASPSVQVDIVPGGEPVVLATHDQLLGGPGDQVYMGCRFPANASYARAVGAHGRAIGKVLADLGAIGRFAADFAAARRNDGKWEVFGLEVNLRKGGTTHPYATLRHLAAGRYDVEAGTWVIADGTERCYESTDNLVDPAWVGRSQVDVIEQIAAAGLHFDADRQTGVVLHMLSCLAIDGRLGLTAIGTSSDNAALLFREAARVLGKVPEAR
jgi:PGM1 C-terminal domain